MHLTLDLIMQYNFVTSVNFAISISCEVVLDDTILNTNTHGVFVVSFLYCDYF